MTTTANPLAALSGHVADAVERAAASVVAVLGRGRPSSSGFISQPGVVVTPDGSMMTLPRVTAVPSVVVTGVPVMATDGGEPGAVMPKTGMLTELAVAACPKLSVTDSDTL